MTAKDAILEGIFEVVRTELTEATEKFGRFASAHEGYAVLLEEVEELWAQIKAKDEEQLQLARLTKEATQVAAMAIRFMLDCCFPEIPDEVEPERRGARVGAPTAAAPAARPIDLREAEGT